MTDPDVCPLCGGPAAARCRCPRGDRLCAKGHAWHTCALHRTTVLGPSGHGTSTFSCTCHTRQPVTK